MRIAIVGSGISGIGCAYFLNQKHHITLFEKNDYVGGHANTSVIDYPVVGSLPAKIAVDTGFIVYNFKTYPNFKPFLEEIKAPIAKSNMSFGIAIKDGLEYSGQSLSSLFAQKKNLFNFRFLKMLWDIHRFNQKAIEFVESGQEAEISLSDFISSVKVGEYFKKYYLLPMAAAIWSCPITMMKNYPAKTFLQFFYNHGLLTITQQPQWYTIKGGSKEYVRLASQNFADKIKLNCAVRKVFRNSSGSFTVTDQQYQEYDFDQVIFACHPHQVLEILQDATDQEKAILGQFKYSNNLAVLHRDPSQMPKNQKAWASWVYLACDQENKVSLSYYMNNLQNIDKRFPLFVTLNPSAPIKEELTFVRYQYSHPIFDLAAIKAQQELPKIQGQRGVYFCGAYTRYGFHEDGLLSALLVLNQLGIKAKWQN